jgi:Transposase DDE domain group 1
VGKSASCYPLLSASSTSVGVVSHAGAALLLQTVDKTGLASELSTALRRWRKPGASHDPGKVVIDLAVALALGGDCLADIALLREQPGVFGPVTSDPTVSRPSRPWPPTRPRRWRRSALRAPRPGQLAGLSQVPRRPIIGLMSFF